MKVNEIAEIIESYAPKELAYSWDNVGLLCGSGDKDVKKILITLDTNLNTVREAIELGCDMIVSHHPILYRSIKRIDFNDPTGEMLRLLIQNDIAVYAAHTNMDTAPCGINAQLAEIFGLCDVEILEFHTDRNDAGLGRFGKLKNEMSFGELTELVKERLNTPLRAAGNFEKKIKTLCVASGSCSECIETAILKGCDAVITGDMKYHETIDYCEKGICIIDAGHYPTEVGVMGIFEKILEKLDNVDLVKSQNSDVFRFV